MGRSAEFKAAGLELVYEGDYAYLTFVDYANVSKGYNKATKQIDVMYKGELIGRPVLEDLDLNYNGDLILKNRNKWRRYCNLCTRPSFNR